MTRTAIFGRSRGTRTGRLRTSRRRAPQNVILRCAGCSGLPDPRVRRVSAPRGKGEGGLDHVVEADSDFVTEAVRVVGEHRRLTVFLRKRRPNQPGAKAGGS